MSEDNRSSATLAVADAIAALIIADGARVALIGAAALAVHGYPRATRDLDLATELDPALQMRALARACAARGWTTELAMPDADDPLGGVLTVRGADFDPVQVVNFYNPLSHAPNPASEALDEALALDATGHLRVVRLEHLVALKLYAGGRKSLADVAALLEANPDADLDRIRDVCVRHGLGAALDRVLAG
jgi:hypothetical protein